MIYGIANLLALALFIALTALPFYLLWLTGAWLGRLFNASALKWVLPFGAVAIVGIWAASSVAVFRSECELVPRIEVLAAAHGAPVGFGLVEDRSSFVGGFFNWDAAISGGAFQFVDLGYGRRCIGMKQNARQPQFPLEARCDSRIPSPISVHLLPPQTLGKWWLPPIYEARIEIRESGTGTVLARATDVIFGGELIGKYMRLVGGDQDFERLSCGYASADIGPWRPSLSTRPRVREYEQADMALLLAPFRETKSVDIAPLPNLTSDPNEQDRRSNQR